MVSRGRIDLKVPEGEAPFALLLRGLIELIRALRYASQVIEGRGKPPWPSNPEVLSRAWRECTSLYDWLQEIGNVAEQYVRVFKANTAWPEMVDGLVGEFEKKLSRLRLVPPPPLWTLRGIASLSNRVSTAKSHVQCPSLCALSALPPNALARLRKPPPESLLFLILIHHALVIVAKEWLRFADLYGEAMIPPLAARLERSI